MLFDTNENFASSRNATANLPALARCLKADKFPFRVCACIHLVSHLQCRVLRYVFHCVSRFDPRAAMLTRSLGTGFSSRGSSFELRAVTNTEWRGGNVGTARGVVSCSSSRRGHRGFHESFWDRTLSPEWDVFRADRHQVPWGDFCAGEFKLQRSQVLEQRGVPAIFGLESRVDLVSQVEGTQLCRSVIGQSSRHFQSKTFGACRDVFHGDARPGNQISVVGNLGSSAVAGKSILLFLCGKTSRVHSGSREGIGKYEVGPNSLRSCGICGNPSVSICAF